MSRLCRRRVGAAYQRATDELDQLVASLDVGHARFSDLIDVEHSSDGTLSRATFRALCDFGTETLVSDPGIPGSG